MPTDVIKTIGATSSPIVPDYTSIQAWNDAAPSNLVTADERWIGECLDQGTFTDSSATISGSTSDATRYKYLRCAAGASFKDKAAVRTTALTYNTSNGVAFAGTSTGTTLYVDEQYARIEGLQIFHNATYYRPLRLGSYTDANQCIIKNGSSSLTGGEAVLMDAASATLRNSLILCPAADNLGITHAGNVYNCTIVCTAASPTGKIVYASYYNLLVLKNCACFGFGSLIGSGMLASSSDYNATDLSAIGTGTHNLTSLTFSSQFVDSTNDFRPSGTSSLQAGTPDSNILVDITGQTRNPSTPWIGCWENNHLSNVIGFWDLDVDANDDSGNGLDGTNTGGTFGGDKWTATGTDNINISLADSTIISNNAFTISAWISVSGSSYYDAILLNGEVSTIWVDKRFGTNRFHVQNSQFTGGTTFQYEAAFDSLEHHCVLVWDGDTLSLYLDGSLVDSSTVAYSMIRGSSFLNFGSFVSEWNQTNITLRDVGLYSDAKSSAWAYDDYNNGTPKKWADWSGYNDPTDQIGLSNTISYVDIGAAQRPESGQAITGSASLTSGILGYWDLDLDSNDDSGNGQNGSDTSISYSGGKAIFNGSSSKIVISSFVKPLNSPWTISYWLTVTDKTAAQYICDGNSNNAISNIVGYQSGYYNLFSDGGGGGVYPDGTSSDSELLAGSGEDLVTWTFDGSTSVKGYVNGVLLKSVAATSNWGKLALTSYTLGCNAQGIAFCAMSMRSFGFWLREFSPQEVYALLNGGTPLKYAGLSGITVPSNVIGRSNTISYVDIGAAQRQEVSSSSFIFPYWASVYNMGALTGALGGQ